MSYELVRPIINWKKTIICVASAILVAFLIGEITGWIADELGFRQNLCNILIFVCYLCTMKISSLECRVVALVIIIEINLYIKPIAIWLVRFYQKYAPESIRDECLFEPSCSNYMIMAIEKYGFYKGFIKGVNRLRRCHQPNGGIDYP